MAETEKTELGLSVGDSSDRDVRLFGILLVVGIFLAIAVFLGIAIKKNAEQLERQKTVVWLNNLPNGYTVRIDGRIATKPVPIVEALKTITPVSPHHSHPLKPLLLEIAFGSQKLDLLVARDSELPSEYWVFLPDPKGGDQTEDR
jgi:hypothetical protein